jgi:hypothetical protein
VGLGCGAVTGGHFEVDIAGEVWLCCMVKML